MIKIKYIFGSFIIDQGKLITDEKDLIPVFNAMDKTVYPEQGEPDFILGNRLMALLGGGEIIVQVTEQSDPSIVY